MRSALTVLLLLLALCASALGQQAAKATLTGTVTDPNGAVIAGASVTATQMATGIRRATVSNDEGLYVLTDLAPGEYEVRVESKGFAAHITTNLMLQVGQTVTVNSQLKIQATYEKTELYGFPPLVNNTDSLVQGVIESREVESLPLNGRNFLELALLVPGNAPAPNFDPTKTNTLVISSAGQLGRGGNVTIDGADTNDDVVGGSIQNISQEAIQEFQIATNRFSAQLG